MPNPIAEATAYVTLQLMFAEFFKAITSQDGFMPLIQSNLGKPGLIWTLAATDFLIGLSFLYLSISLLLLARRIHRSFSGMFLALGIFAAACSVTHLFGVFTLWVPDYGLAALIQVLAAAAAVATVSILYHRNQELIRFVKTTQTTEKRSAELQRINMELTLVHDRYRQLVEGVRDYAIFTLDPRGIVTSWNEGAKRIKQYEAGEIVGKHFSTFYPIEDQKAGKPALELEEAEKSGRLEDEGWRVRKDGSRFWASVLITALRNTEGELIGFSKITRDMTERKLAEDQLRRSNAQLEAKVAELALVQSTLVQSAKMAALGEMAAGIAHEINTPLTSITLRARQLERRIATLPGSTAAETAEATKIAATAKRISMVIQGLRTFARDGSDDPIAKISIHQLFENTLSLCQNHVRNLGIELRQTALPTGGALYCRATQIEQVLLNLLNNAQDAVVGQPGAWINLQAREANLGIEISVTDSGPGIPPALREKLMQPFFTTKAVGKGTGLGLSISKGIVEAHGGTLRLDEESLNTRFVLWLPTYKLAETAPQNEGRGANE